MELQIGETYQITHSRKGAFTGRLVGFDDNWAIVEITAGKAGAMLDFNERKTGEQVTVRRSFTTFTKATQ